MYIERKTFITNRLNVNRIEYLFPFKNFIIFHIQKGKNFKKNIGLDGNLL